MKIILVGFVLFFRYLSLLQQLSPNSLYMHLQKYRETQKRVRIVVYEEYQNNVLKKVFDLMDLIETQI